MVGDEVEGPADRMNGGVDDDQVTEEGDKHRPYRQSGPLRASQEPDAAKEKWKAEDTENRGTNQERSGNQPLVGLALREPRFLHVLVEAAVGSTGPRRGFSALATAAQVQWGQIQDSSYRRLTRASRSKLTIVNQLVESIG